jgi:hypothetical protein
MLQQQIIILSAVTSKGDRTQDLAIDLFTLGYSYEVAKGHYKGESETSFIIKVPFGNEPNHSMFQFIADKYKQECYLYSDANRFTTLHYRNREESLGRLVSTDEYSARQQDSFTEVNGNFYITRKV